MSATDAGKRRVGPVAVLLAIGFLALVIGEGLRTPPDAPAPAFESPPVAAAPAAAAPVVAPVPAAAPPAAPNVLARRAALEKKALAGDYQAQRNLAYSLGREIPVNELQSCAWRIVVLGSGAPEVDDSDLGNKTAACDRKLSGDGLYAASMQAVTLQGKIEALRK